MGKPRMVQIGPCVTNDATESQFSSLPPALHDVWTITGPSAERNLRTLPLWAVVAAAYMEGVNHGAGAATPQPPAPARVEVVGEIVAVGAGGMNAAWDESFSPYPGMKIYAALAPQAEQAEVKP